MKGRERNSDMGSRKAYQLPVRLKAIMMSSGTGSNMVVRRFSCDIKIKLKESRVFRCGKSLSALSSLDFEVKLPAHNA